MPAPARALIRGIRHSDVEDRGGLKFGTGLPPTGGEGLAYLPGAYRLAADQSRRRTIGGRGGPVLIRPVAHAEPEVAAGNDVGVSEPGTGELLAVQLYTLDEDVVGRVVLGYHSKCGPCRFIANSGAI